MIPVPPLVFATPEADVQNGNGIIAMVVNSARWNADRILACSLVFKRESVYDAAKGSLDQEATALLLANNNLHYGRTTDVEKFFIAYDENGTAPLGIGFGSFGSPQSWTSGLGIAVPAIGGRHIVTFKDDQPLTPTVDPRVVEHNGINILPWDALEAVSADALTRRLYISTPNHMFDFINRNPDLQHVDQKHSAGGFQQLVNLPSDEFASEEEVARAHPDEADPHVRDVLRQVARWLFHRDWLF